MPWKYLQVIVQDLLKRNDICDMLSLKFGETAPLHCILYLLRQAPNDKNWSV